MKTYIASLIMFSLFVLCPAFAATNPYQIALPADTQNEDERTEVVREGLLEVLENVSGDEQIEYNAIIQSNVNKADRYVQEYRYLRPTDKTASSKYLLVIRYNKNDVTRLLKKSGFVNKKAAAPTQWISLRVSHVLKSQEVDELMRNIKQLAPVRQVTLTQLSGDEIDLDVLVSGSLESFQQLASNQHLVFKTHDDAANKFIYEWVTKD